jgi:hypothetical protein
MASNVQLNSEAHGALRLYKTIAGHKSYSEAVIHLMNEAGHEVPEGGISNEELMQKVFG